MLQAHYQEPPPPGPLGVRCHLVPCHPLYCRVCFRQGHVLGGHPVTVKTRKCAWARARPPSVDHRRPRRVLVPRPSARGAARHLVERRLAGVRTAPPPGGLPGVSGLESGVCRASAAREGRLPPSLALGRWLKAPLRPAWQPPTSPFRCGVARAPFATSTKTKQVL